MEITTYSPPALVVLRKKARNAVDIALSYERTYRKVQRMGVMHTVVDEYRTKSIMAWDDVEELYSEIARYKERMSTVLECWDPLECRIYDV